MANQTSENQETIKKIKDLIKDEKVAMLTTLTPEGKLMSRPMRTQEVEMDMDKEEIWFITEKDTEKYRDIERNSAVNLAYAGNSYVSISGTAEFVQDEDKKNDYWNKILGRLLNTSPDDPNVVLVKVTPEIAEYWESGVNVKTVKEFVKKMTSNKSLDDSNDLKDTVHFDQNTR
ncbi:General stress protein 26 [Thalassobacillus cyri]|uniref:General stress protein 26 n=1 Tax=Thalassobacillus cyri TaxID=571932 RepID=A0A1H4F229_9BACI|nr:pyridoxamine 5'-phosphate oxidase family protein [Thalassobacillus cyri]SEA91040.1 General stress protein 26 [Thalassobacillus cyri]